MAKSKKSGSRYERLLTAIFLSKWKKCATEVAFVRADLERAAKREKIDLPKNLGDVIYSFRYRGGQSADIAATAPGGKEWVIKGTGQGSYQFRLVTINRLVPDPKYLPIKIPDSTPEIIVANAKSDEQALLAKVRYNRLVDIFLGVTAYSLQNHLRTTVVGVGQIEIDEVYVGVDKTGSQYVIPVQAKGGGDQLSVVQTEQDVLCCNEKFTALRCRPVSAQFMADDRIALFELALVNDEIRIVDQRHYLLTPAADISDDDLKRYRKS